MHRARQVYTFFNFQPSVKYFFHGKRGQIPAVSAPCQPLGIQKQLVLRRLALGTVRHTVRNVRFQRQGAFKADFLQRIGEIVPVNDTGIRQPVTVAVPVVVMYVQDAQKLLARHAHRIANRQTEHSAVPGVQADLEIRMIQRPDKFQDRLRRPPDAP